MISDSDKLGFDSEGQMEASDGINLHYLSRQVDHPKYQIIAVHGLGEHAGRYAWFAQQIAMDGGNFCILDLRGHGRSNGRRGHSSSYQQLISDIEFFVSQQKIEDIPAFFFGHSLGGGLAINYALELSSDTKDVDSIFLGFIASSPLLKLSFEPPTWKLFLARALAKIWPSFSLDRDINPDVLTRDKNLVEAYRTDPLNHELVSAAMTLGFLEAGESALRAASKLKIPTLILHGEEDQVTDIKSSRQFAESAAGVASFKSFPDCYHELINEINRDQVVGFITEWIHEKTEI